MKTVRSNLAARFYVQPKTRICVGVSVINPLEEGCVYEVTTDFLGNLVINNLGKSLITGTELEGVGIDQLLVRSQGKHCLVDGEI